MVTIKTKIEKYNIQLEKLFEKGLNCIKSKNYDEIEIINKQKLKIIRSLCLMQTELKDLSNSKDNNEVNKLLFDIENLINN